MRTLTLTTLLVLVPSVAAAHGASKSYADWTVEGDRAALRVSFASHDIAAAMGTLDEDGDRRVLPAELEAVRGSLGARIVEHTTVTAGRDTPDARCAPGEPSVRGIGDPIEEVQITLVYVCPSAIGAMRLQSKYLPELEPPHATLATVSGTSESAQHVFTPSTPDFDIRFELPPLSEVVKAALLAGLKASFTWASMLFCFGLMLSRRGRNAGAVLAIFLVSHALLVFLGGPRFPFLPLIIALAVAWVGFETFVSEREPKTSPHNLAMAGIFGVLFGVTAHVGVPKETIPKVAFVMGATAPLLLAFLAARVVLAVAGANVERVVRIAGATIIAGGAVLAIVTVIQ